MDPAKVPQALAEAKPLQARSVESAMLDRALDNLFNVPTGAHDLDLKHQQLSALLEQKEHQLEALKAERVIAAERAEAIKLDLKSVEHRLHLVTDSSAELSQQAARLKSDMDAVLRDNARLEVQLAMKTQEAAEAEKCRESYRSKMAAHVAQITKHEHDSLPIYKQLKNQQQVVDDLLRQRHEMGQDEAEQSRVKAELRASLEQEQKAQQEMDAQITKATGRLQTTNAQNDKIRQDIEVLNRRNAAQKMRAKHQLKEMTARNRHWQEQAARLRDSLQ